VTKKRILTEGCHDQFGVLAKCRLPRGMVLQFIPSLAAMLVKAEELKGRPLTEAEVFKIRDACPVVVIKRKHSTVVTEKREYKDINPAHVWRQWKRLKSTWPA
jgi:hypothetical protein